MVWALPRSLATTRGIICLFSLPTGTKMFQFPAYAFISNMNDMSSTYRVVPFGNPRIIGHLHLPKAYRSLSRPSSLVRAKASSVRPFLLSLRYCCTIIIISISYFKILSLYVFLTLVNFSLCQYVNDRFT